MFKSFVTWLDSYISREEPATILKSLVGLMAFAGLLGTIFGNQAIRVGAFVVVIVFVVSVILLLLADRRRLQRECATHRDLVARYDNLVMESSPEPLISVEDWSQRVYVRSNGDVREVLTIKAVALREEVHFLRFHMGSAWNQPERYRSKVEVYARSIGIDGTVGPHWNVTGSWLSASKMRSIVHLRSPLARGEEIRLEMIRIWPAKCLPLMRDGAADTFTFRRTDRMPILRIEYQVILPTGFNATYEPVGFTEPHSKITVDAFTDTESRRVIACRVNDLPERITIGMRLELA